MIFIALAINSGHYLRNYDLYKNPLGVNGEDSETKVTNDVFNIQSTLSIVLRNIGLHVGTANSQVNAAIEKGVLAIHRALGVDINDPRTTYQRQEFHINKPARHESGSGNPIHLALIVIAFILLFIVPPQKNKGDLRQYVFLLIAAFLLFSLVVNWQPWHSRLHLPLFILWSPLIAILLSQGARIIGPLLNLAALPYIFNNDLKSVVRKDIFAARREHYFIGVPQLRDPFLRACEYISSQRCANVGLIIGGNDFEYPFFALLKKNGCRDCRIEHVNVANITRIKGAESPFNNFVPCAIISSSEAQNAQKDLVCKNRVYVKTWSLGQVSIFMPVSP